MKIVVLTVILLTSLIKSNAQVSDEPRDIQAYFDLIKAEYFCDLLDAHEKIVDIRNGYLAFNSLDADSEPLFQMALFKDSKGNDQIAIHSPGYACGDIFACAHTEERKTHFFKYKNEEWIDVSDAVLPQIKTEHFYNDTIHAQIVNKYATHAIAYELPRFGQTIKLKLEICDGYINFDDPYNPIVSDEQIEIILQERKTLLLKWNKSLGVLS